MDIVIDHHYKDPKTLAKFALVCKEWAITARFHLWRTVTLGEHGRFGLEDFLRFTIDRPHIGFLVRDVKVQFHLTEQPPDIDVMGTILRLLKSLPEVESLLMDRMYFTPHHSRAHDVMNHEAVSRKMKYVRLSRCRFETIEPLEQLCRTFPGIHDLDILRCLVDQPDPLLQADTTLLPCLTRLSLMTFNQTQFMTWITQSLCLSKLTNLKIWMLEGHLQTWLPRAPLVLGPSLQSVHFVNSAYTPCETPVIELFCYSHQLPTVWKQFLVHLDLSHAVSLKSLIVETRADDPPASIDHIFQTILRKVASPHIEEVLLRLDTAAFIHKLVLTEIDWSGVDNILDGPNFKNLKKLTFNLGTLKFAFGKDRVQLLDALWRENVLKEFHKTASRGVEVVYVYGNLKTR
ncbi:hypothetical protein NLI96_g9908 [Meripilus lineatus]|uniref:F-box domain-containing protein n=1 Tax=Meripilus lineatus TaxID=2056292 RepID=A0AAD5YEV0_9APHY|nr:hypothetical protein NLI96_g9908 [Physisporinus lineatus]